MRTQPTVERTSTSRAITSPTGLLTILSVSPVEEDHLSLQAIIGHSTWTMFQARDLASAVALLRQHEIAVVICDRDLLLARGAHILGCGPTLAPLRASRLDTRQVCRGRPVGAHTIPVVKTSVAAANTCGKELDESMSFPPST